MHSTKLYSYPSSPVSSHNSANYSSQPPLVSSVNHSFKYSNPQKIDQIILRSNRLLWHFRPLKINSIQSQIPKNTSNSHRLGLHGLSPQTSLHTYPQCHSRRIHLDLHPHSNIIKHRICTIKHLKSSSKSYSSSAQSKNLNTHSAQDLS